jgi:nitrate reductase NapE
MTEQCPKNEQEHTKKDELKALGFIIVILFPALSSIFVGAYGLVIWIILAFSGVPAH